MNAPALKWEPHGNSVTSLTEETVSLLVGCAVTLGLFAVMAYWEQPAKKVQPEETEDMRLVSVPLEAPPPPIVQQAAQPESATVAGIDVAAAESPVRIAVSLPPLEILNVAVAPPANIRTSSYVTDFKPKIDAPSEIRRIYQQTEVDRKPFVLVDTKPHIPPVVRHNAYSLRVMLLMVINTDGSAHDLRVLESSGNLIFDDIVARCIRDEWVFSPAVKKGRNVRCMVQRAITVTWSASPFET